MPSYERELEAARREGLTTDAEGFIWGALEALLYGLAGVAVDKVLDIFRREAHRHTNGWKAAVNGAIGIDLEVVVKEEDLTGYLALAADRSANLITGLVDDLRKRIRDRSIQAVLQGESLASYRKVLAEQFELSDNRARLIARDQVAKLTSDLNRIRQQQAGIGEYQWSTAHDERVRLLHQHLEGKQYRWGEPTGAEQGLPPGQPIQCRCVARAVLKF
ncbi:phage minor head protein [Aquabacter sp. CN5-332]|uniref:phage head morphogenesis protein n=1 Tax=Aquabacter sp. CN5-332 TaxID=3156608 RepID=UPI0032B3229F